MKFPWVLLGMGGLRLHVCHTRVLQRWYSIGLWLGIFRGGGGGTVEASVLCVCVFVGGGGGEDLSKIGNVPRLIQIHAEDQHRSYWYFHG